MSAQSQKEEKAAPAVEKRERGGTGEAPKRKIGITETALRDAHQSIMATRLRTEDMIPVAEQMDEVGYHSLEVWGGATFDTCMRFLEEDPWERLRVRKRFRRQGSRCSFGGRTSWATGTTPTMLREFVKGPSATAST